LRETGTKDTGGFLQVKLKLKLQNNETGIIFRSHVRCNNERKRKQCIHDARHHQG
jgi:hypothetical protein